MDIKDRYIDYLYIQDSFAPLVKMAIDRDLFYDNIPNDVSAWSKIGPTRMAFDFAAFDRINEIYYAKEKKLRSKLFYSVQEEIIELISSKSDSCTGKKKKYFQDFNRQIAHIDCSLKDRFKKILFR